MFAIKIFFILVSIGSIISSELICSRHPELELIHCKINEKPNDDRPLTIASYKSLENQNFDGERDIEITHTNLGRLFPHGIGRTFTNLVSLDVSSSLVAVVDQQCFRDMRQLKDLRLFFNNIETLPADTFHDLHDLEILNLAKNVIKSLPQHVFDNNQQLKVLRLNENRLEAIESGVFGRNLQLRELSLQKNAIKRVAFDFSVLVNVGVLDLGGNEGSCGVRFDKRELGRELEMVEVQAVIAGACNL
jgi:Leucine-rich repeat (LRR) protein